MSQCFTACFGVVDVFQCRCHVMVGRLRDSVNDIHGFFAATRCRHGGRAVRILLEVPLCERFVVAALAGMQHPGGRCSDGVGLGGGGVNLVVTFVMSHLGNRHHQTAVRITD